MARDKVKDSLFSPEIPIELEHIRFREMFRMIEEYQRKMGYDPTEMPPEQRMQMFRNYIVALMMEQAEMADEVSWKPWRKYEDQKPKPNMKKIALEWVDCLFFLVDQALMLGLTSEAIVAAFDRKHKANLERIASGYSKIKDNTQ